MPQYNLDADLTDKIDEETDSIMIKTTVGDEFKRGAELSAITKFLYNDQETLITAGDRSGIMHTIDNQFDLTPIYKLYQDQTYSDHRLKYLKQNDLDYKQLHNRGYKIEWMTVQNNEYLYIGAPGLEQYDFKTRKISAGSTWIGKLDRNGNMETMDWMENYNKIRMSCGCLFPGWMYIECLIWSNYHQKWFILPRFIAINAPFDKTHGNYGGNILIIASEDFNDIKIVNLEFEKPVDNDSEYVNNLYIDNSIVEHDWNGAKSEY